MDLIRSELGFNTGSEGKGPDGLDMVHVCRERLDLGLLYLLAVEGCDEVQKNDFNTSEQQRIFNISQDCVLTRGIAPESAPEVKEGCVVLDKILAKRASEVQAREEMERVLVQDRTEFVKPFHEKLEECQTYLDKVKVSVLPLPERKKQ